jgi:hypothetical protein
MKLRTVFYAMAMLAIFILFLYAVQFSTPHLLDNDGFYHIKMAYLMRTQGLKPGFPYLPLTILNPSDYVDHHFLFHVAQIPFTFGDLRLGAKWATVVIAALAFLAVWWLFYQQQIPYAGLWALGLLVVSEAFIFRMSSPRAQSLSLGVLALAVYFLMSKKFLWLFPLAFLYVWAYDAFPLIGIVAVVYAIAALLVEGRERIAKEGLIKGVWRVAGAPVAITAAGVLLGMIVNPYFPQNLVFMVRHIAPKLSNPTSTNVGSEWYPYNTLQLLGNSGVSLAIFVLGIFALGFAGKRMSTNTTFSLLLAVLFAGMLFQARRYIEYFPAFSLIFAAFAFKPLLEQRQAIEDHLPVTEPSAVGGLSSVVGIRLPNHLKVRSVVQPLLGLLILTPLLWYNLKASRTSVTVQSDPYQTYADASAWLVKNTPAGARVFQTDWDDFPRLFFYNSHNTYLVGLDPTYMQLYNAKLYDEWVNITQGRVSNLSQAITQDFGCTYVISDLAHGDFLRIAQQDQGLEEVYRDMYAVVFRLR